MGPHWTALLGAITVALPAAAARRYTPAEVWRAVRGWIACHGEVFWVAALLLVVGLAHGINMFHYPYFETDEGTYMSQAWSVLAKDALQPYTYWYDHAPVGWLQISAWVTLTGGFHTFGSAEDSGRVMMLVYHLISCVLLYGIARRLSGNAVAPSIAVLLFSFSPFGIYFQRRVLLDNITDLWMLVCIFLLLSPKLSLSKIWLSAVALGISILSKEVTFFLIPVLAYLVFYRSHRTQRAFAAIGWLTIVFALLSLYVLMAILKGELFPQYSLLGGTSPHVSLLGTLEYQASRGKDGGLLDPSSQFYHAMASWARETPTLLIGGAAGALLMLLAFKINRLVAIMGMVTLSMFAFLARGGEVIDFYLVPMLPLFALNIALTLDIIVGPVTRWARLSSLPRPVLRLLQLCAILIAVVPLTYDFKTQWQALAGNPWQFWQSTQADAQPQSFAWVRAHVPPNSYIIIDNYMYTDLHDGAQGTPVFANAHWYWKVQEDPAIKGKVFHNTWKTADYVVTTNQMLSDIKVQSLTLIGQAVEHSVPLAAFDTEGWPVMIRKVIKPGEAAPNILAASGAIVPTTQFYFAGGVATASADTALHLINPHLRSASVQITFYYSNGATYIQSLGVDASSKKTLNISDIEPRSNFVGFAVHSSRPITAFATVNVLGADSNLPLLSKGLATRWDLAENYTGLIAGGDLSILNPDPAKAAHVRLLMRQIGGGTSSPSSITVPAHSIRVIDLHPAEVLDITVQSDQPVAADRTIRYSQAGYALALRNGNHITTWLTSQASGKNDTRTYLTLLNGSCAATLVYPGGGAPVAWPGSNAGLLLANCRDASRLPGFLRANNLKGGGR